ncbi:MAG: hypothetical protein ACOH5I_04320 [Oligoflexus sp.]
MDVQTGKQISRGKPINFRRTTAGFTLGALMDLDFAVDRQLVCLSRLVSSFYSSAHVFATHFLQTTSRDGALVLR